ncbi:MAG: SDR family oxidoreductase [Hymenobacter sp.]
MRAIGRQARRALRLGQALPDLDHLYDVVQAEKGKVDVLYASAGHAEFGLTLDTITEAQYEEHFNLNTKGTLFTVQKALPLLSDGATVLLTGTANMTTVVPRHQSLQRQQAGPAAICAHLDAGAEKPPHPVQHHQPRPHRHAPTGQLCPRKPLMASWPRCLSGT